MVSTCVVAYSSGTSSTRNITTNHLPLSGLLHTRPCPHQRDPSGHRLVHQQNDTHYCPSPATIPRSSLAQYWGHQQVQEWRDWRTTLHTRCRDWLDTSTFHDSQ